MQRIDLQKTPFPQAIAQTMTILQQGGLVIFPTETTYGAGVIATNQVAVDKLLAFKARREGKPLSIAVATPEIAARYVEVNESAQKLYQRFLPGPVTVVSKGLGKVAQGVESEFGTLGIRIPDYQFILKLLQQLDQPLTATSANASGAKRPYTIEDVFAGLSQKQANLIDLVLDAGELPHRPPSTVIDTTLSTPVIFRQGDVEIISPQQTTTLISKSEQETRDLAKRLVLKYWNEMKSTGLVIGLNGSLGMGKTIFAKGVAEYLQISAEITSPTYTYIEEYDFSHHGVKGKFFHLDLWKISTPEEIELLQLPQLLQPQTVVVIEWAANAAAYLQNIFSKEKIKYLEVELASEENSSHRSLKIKE